MLRMDNGESIAGSRRYKDVLAAMPAAIGGRKEAEALVTNRP